MFCFQVILRILYFSTLSPRLTLLEHTSKFVRSSCSEDASSVELMVLKIFVSSAKVAIFELFTVLERRFSHKRNSNGPSIEPCGTPDVTAIDFDLAPWTVVC